MIFSGEQGWLSGIVLRDVSFSTLLLFSVLFKEREFQINLEQIADMVGDLGCLFVFL